MDINTFGKNLRKAREAADLTQGRLRDLMESEYQVVIGRTYISELERLARKGQAKKTPTLEVADAMARVCGTSLNFLAGMTEDMGPPADRELEPFYRHPETDTVARIIDRMSSEKRIEILNVVRQMAEAEGSQRQRRSQQARMLLSLIERLGGAAARREVERWLRESGYIFPMDDENRDDKL